MPPELAILNAEQARDALVRIFEKEIGVREIGGNNCGPRIREYQSATNLDPGPWPYCFESSVDVLSEDGWIKFTEIGKRKIAQVDPITLTASFVNPISVIHKKSASNLMRVRNRSLDFVCDSGHRMFGSTLSRGVRNRHIPVGEISGVLSIPRIKYAANESKWSDEQIEFIAAFVSDGFFHRRSPKHRQKIRIQVSKNRKIKALRLMSPVAEYPYKNTYGTQKTPQTCFEFEIPDYFREVFCDYKEIKWAWALSLSARQMEIFVDGYEFWDGCVERNEISTSRQNGADIISAMCLLCGRHPNVKSRKLPGRKTNFTISNCRDKKTRTIRKSDILQINGSMDLHCAEVPKGLILVRDKGGTPFLSGNCAGFIDWGIREWLKSPSVRKFLGLTEEKAEKWRPKTAGAFDMVRWAKSIGLKVLDEDADVRRGDLIIFDFSHIGVITKDAPSRFVNLFTVEGNTGPSGGRDGDGVWDKTRHRSLAKCFIRLC